MARLVELLFAAAVLLLLIVVAVPVGWQWWSDDRVRQMTDDAYVQGDFRTLAAKLPGYVAQILVADYANVEAGQPILKIEDDDYRAKVDAAQATLDGKSAALEDVEALVNQQQTIINQATAQTNATLANLAFAKVQLQRATTLLGTAGGMQSTVDQTNASFRALSATLDANRAAEAQARGQVAVLMAQRKQAVSDIADAKAALTLAQIDLDHTVIRAPVKGSLGKRAVFEGEYLAAGSGVISLTPLETVWVAANFRETQLTHMKEGQVADVMIDSFPGVVVRGHVEALAPTSGGIASLLPPDNATGNFTKIVQRVPVKIVLEPGNALSLKLRPGMSSIVTVDVAGAACAGQQSGDCR